MEGRNSNLKSICYYCPFSCEQMLADICSILQDNNPFSEEYQEREQMEKMRESHGKQIPPGGPLEKSGKYYYVINQVIWYCPLPLKTFVKSTVAFKQSDQSGLSFCHYIIHASSVCPMALLFCLICCFTSQVNSYGHGRAVSSPNYTFSWASLNKQSTSTSCTYFGL